MHLLPLPRAAVALPGALALTVAAALAGCGAGASPAGPAADTVPPYYAETIAIRPPAYDSPLNLSIRSTTAGDETAALRALPPYESIGFVAGTGKPNWWIAGAQAWHPVNGDNSAQPAKLYLATMESALVDGEPMPEDRLTPLPAPPMRASRTVTLSFPAKQAKAGTPDGCDSAPVATSDGQRVLCPGPATYPVNAAGTTEAGIWVFSARTGTLTAAWNTHPVCCSLTGTEVPRILWVSPHGTFLIADGMSTQNQGAQLFLRTADGTLQQLPWKGLTRRPGQAAISEPSVAW